MTALLSVQLKYYASHQYVLLVLIAVLWVLL